MGLDENQVPYLFINDVNVIIKKYIIIEKLFVLLRE